MRRSPARCLPHRYSLLGQSHLRVFERAPQRRRRASPEGGAQPAQCRNGGAFSSIISYPAIAEGDLQFNFGSCLVPSSHDVNLRHGGRSQLGHRIQSCDASLGPPQIVNALMMALIREGRSKAGACAHTRSIRRVDFFCGIFCLTRSVGCESQRPRLPTTPR